MKTEFFDKLTEGEKYVRETVFIKEQKFSEEFDDIDKIAVHLVVTDEDKPIGTGRLFKENETDDSFHIGRVAVLKEYRKNKIGNLILLKLEEKAKELGGKKIELSAQCRVKQFYKQNGYVEIGEEYLDEYCPHIKMEKYL